MSLADKLSLFPGIQQAVGILTIGSNAGKLCLDILKTINNIGVSILKPIVEMYHYSKALTNYPDSIENANSEENRSQKIFLDLIEAETPPARHENEENDFEETRLSESIILRKKKPREEKENRIFADAPISAPMPIPFSMEDQNLLESVNIKYCLNQAKKNRPWHLKSKLQGDDQIYLMAKEAGENFKSKYEAKTDFKKHFESIGVGFLRIIPGIGSYYSYNRCKKINLES